MLKVQNSRMVLRSPISSRVGSPAYFLSCGSRRASELEDAVVAADGRVALDHAMRADRVPAPISRARR